MMSLVYYRKKNKTKRRMKRPGTVSTATDTHRYSQAQTYSKINGRNMESLNYYNIGVKKLILYVMNKIIFHSYRNYFCNMKLTVRGGFEWELEQCGVLFCFVTGVLMYLVIPCTQNLLLANKFSVLLPVLRELGELVHVACDG